MSHFLSTLLNFPTTQILSPHEPNLLFDAITKIIKIMTWKNNKKIQTWAIKEIVKVRKCCDYPKWSTFFLNALQHARGYVVTAYYDYNLRLLFNRLRLKILYVYLYHDELRFFCCASEQQTKFLIDLERIRRSRKKVWRAQGRNDNFREYWSNNIFSP